MLIALKPLDLPDPLAQALKRRAAASNVTIEEQIVRDLASVEVNISELPEPKLLELIRQDRDEMKRNGIWLTEEFLVEAKSLGRK